LPILDKADDLDLLPPFLPPTSGGHIVLRICAESIVMMAHRLAVDVFDQEAGALLLLCRARLLDVMRFCIGPAVPINLLRAHIPGNRVGCPCA